MAINEEGEVELGPPQMPILDIGLEFASFSAFDPGAHQVKREPDREGGAGKTH